MEIEIVDRSVMTHPGENKHLPEPGDAPGPTEASSCFLTPPAHHLVSHLISVPQTTLSTSWFLLSVQHSDAGQDWA